MQFAFLTMGKRNLQQRTKSKLNSTFSHKPNSPTAKKQEEKMFVSTTQLPSITTMMSVLASAAAIFMLIRSYARQFLPPEVSAYIDQIFRNFVARIFSELTFAIEEYDDGLNENKLFKAAKLYLEPKIPPNMNRIKICLTEKVTKVSLSVEKNEEIVDFF